MKVRCSECGKQINSFCTQKKSKVSLNKKRKCGSYDHDDSKVKEKHDIPSVIRSDWEWKRKEYKKLIKEQMKSEQTAKNQEDLSKAPNYMKDSKHPLTGDLSRFVSTAE